MLFGGSLLDFNVFLLNSTSNSAFNLGICMKVSNSNNPQLQNATISISFPFKCRKKNDGNVCINA